MAWLHFPIYTANLVAVLCRKSHLTLGIESLSHKAETESNHIKLGWALLFRFHPPVHSDGACVRVHPHALMRARASCMRVRPVACLPACLPACVFLSASRARGGCAVAGVVDCTNAGHVRHVTGRRAAESEASRLLWWGVFGVGIGGGAWWGVGGIEAGRLWFGVHKKWVGTVGRAGFGLVARRQAVLRCRAASYPLAPPVKHAPSHPDLGAAVGEGAGSAVAGPSGRGGGGPAGAPDTLRSIGGRALASARAGCGAKGGPAAPRRACKRDPPAGPAQTVTRYI